MLVKPRDDEGIDGCFDFRGIRGRGDVWSFGRVKGPGRIGVGLLGACNSSGCGAEQDGDEEAECDSWLANGRG